MRSGEQAVLGNDLLSLMDALSIEQAVVAALYAAHAKKQPLGNSHILEEAQRTRPLSVVMNEKITALRMWAQDRTVAAD